MDFLKRICWMLLLAASALTSGCVTGEQQVEEPIGSPVITQHAQCQAQHVPSRPDGLPPDAQLIWTSSQPTPEHVNLWVSALELQRVMQIRQAMGVIPNLKNQLDQARDQVRLWESEPDSVHRNAQLRQWTEERDRLQGEVNQLAVVLGQPQQNPAPMPFPQTRR